jgi:hypothetical protein
VSESKRALTADTTAHRERTLGQQKGSKRSKSSLRKRAQISCKTCGAASIKG